MQLRTTPFHLTPSSPWPFYFSVSLYSLVLCFLFGLLHNFSSFMFLVFFSSTVLGLLWARDILRETTFQSFYSSNLYANLIIGLLLFLLSEVMLFFSFFWAFFHFSLAPSIVLGLSFPPVGVPTFSPFSVAFLNTTILLSSGAVLTWSHYSLLCHNFSDSAISLFFTVFLGVIFLAFQGFEYFSSGYSISSSSFGSIFFIGTGFHSAHVFIGAMMLSLSLWRLWQSHFSSDVHTQYLFAIWYWHFVDVIWVILYVFFYCWVLL